VRLSLVKQTVEGLLDAVDQFPSTDSLTYEQHTAFALELAARALLGHLDRAEELLPLFVKKFESVAEKVSCETLKLQCPFVVERVVVTMLRACIHLYQVPSVRNGFEFI